MLINIPTFTMNIPEAVDNLGVINQRIAELEATARKIKSELIARGAGKYEGAQYIAEVQHYERATISPVLVKEFATSEFVAQVTQVKPVDAVVVKQIGV
jgi:hypothetical protein